jgi:hypothetical protein
MKLIISIDTEEDNWGTYPATDHSVENIKEIPRLQELFDKFGAKPTYLVSYPVATDEHSISILKGISDAGHCEIGMHCHPWNTPPHDEVIDIKSINLCNLPEPLQFQKLQILHKTIVQNFKVKPVSFRAGRWGYSAAVAEAVSRLGYQVDSSIISYTNWGRQYGPNFSKIPPEPFRFNPSQIEKADPDGIMLEIPATVGYLQNYFNRINDLHHELTTIERWRTFRLAGILAKLGLLNKIWMSPENSGGSQMIQLARNLIKNGSPVINLFFHSSSLKAGLTEFVRTEADLKQFYKRIGEFLAFAKAEGIEPITLDESPTKITF